MIDSITPTFTEDEARTIWRGYFRDVEALCGMLDNRQKADIEAEIKAHLLESFIQLDGPDEAARIKGAIDRLGNPQEFVPLWVEERLLDESQPGAGTRNLFVLLRTNALKGIRQFAVAMVAGFGYLLSFYFFAMAVLKVFFPDNVGFYVAENGVAFLGYVDAEGFRELLGYWLIPIGLTVAVSLQILLNHWVRRRTGRRRDQAL